jgi:dolichol-phosphate mannosyltransferase
LGERLLKGVATKMKELSVVMPVYNEGEVIGNVLHQWLSELHKLGVDFDFYVFNDGSTDNTLSEVRKVALVNHEVKVIDKVNSGHGPTILDGYKMATGSWIFQMDSDNEIQSDQFAKLWMKRAEASFIIGRRVNRKAALSRRVISLISRLTVWTLYGKGITDVNCPFRLFRNEQLSRIIQEIPGDTFAPNVLISGMAARTCQKIIECDVDYYSRATGEVSIKNLRLLKVAAVSWWQTVRFRLTTDLGGAEASSQNWPK